MIKSMTGFGRGDAAEGTVRYEVEVRGVNHRFLEQRFRIPPEAAGFEPELRRQISEKVKRGRLDVTINRSVQKEPEVNITVNHNVISRYLEAVQRLRSEVKVPGDLSLESLLSLPGAVKIDYPRAEGSEEEKELLLQALEEAITRYEKARVAEGERLFRDLSERVDAVGKDVEIIEGKAVGLASEYAEKVRKRVEELLDGRPLDEARLAQEVAYLAERSDVTEEIVRLRAHLEAARSRLEADDGPVGKALDHLVQEMHRETSTIGSKTTSLEVTQVVLRVKGEVEKLREQIQNIE